MERLQKRIADSGLTSRRKAEELIRQGRVSVNDELISEMGYLVKKDDVVKVDGKLLPEKERNIYLAINKPQGYICTTDDELGRKTIMDLVPEKYKKIRLFNLGRLDANTTGIIILTNDGAFKNQVAGPHSGIEKEYLVRVKGIVKSNEIKMLLNGITHDGVKYLPPLIYLESVDKEHDSSLLTVVITDGKNHEIKNMFDYINHPVKKLKRVRYGAVTIAGLNYGESRELTIHEVKLLINESKKEKNLRGR